MEDIRRWDKISSTVTSIDETYLRFPFHQFSYRKLEELTLGLVLIFFLSLSLSFSLSPVCDSYLRLRFTNFFHFLL